MKNEETLLGVVGSAAPLRVVVPEYTTQSIAQLTPISSVTNTITVTLSTSISLSSDLASTIEISGLVGLGLSTGDVVAVSDVAGRPQP